MNARASSVEIMSVQIRSDKVFTSIHFYSLLFTSIYCYSVETFKDGAVD